MDLPVNLTPRQIHILKAIIEEYIQTADPVGSETLEKKYSLSVSPATIRNEMVRLTDLGFLQQPHASAGRTPTPGALRLYVDQLMKIKDLSVAEEVAVKEKMWDFRQEMDKVLRESTRTLALKTKTLALTITNDGDMYYSGAAHILDMPEFFDYELTHHLLATLDESDFWWSLLMKTDNPFDILLGPDIGTRNTLEQCGFVYAKFQSSRLSGAIGVVGPFRLNYPYVIPIVRYMGSLINEFAHAW